MTSIRIPDDVLRPGYFDPPRLCVCCGATSTTVMKHTVRGLASTLALPMCARCAEHETLADNKWVFGCLAFIAAFWVLPAALPSPLGGLVGIGLIAAGIWWVIRGMNSTARRRGSLLGSNCSATPSDPPVKIVPYEDQPIVLEFRNDRVASVWEAKLMGMKMAQTMFGPPGTHR